MSPPPPPPPPPQLMLPPPPPPPPLLLLPPPPPPQSLVTSEVESRKESNSEDVLLPPQSSRNESDSEDVEESDSEDEEESDVEESEDNESSDFVGEEPASPEDVSIEELIEELYTPVHGGERKDNEFWTRYFQQVRESEGFDIKDYPGSCPLTTVYPMEYYVKGPNNLKMLKGYAAKALEQYNEKNGTKYEVKDILKLNGECCRDFKFYITFTVTNGEKEYFQAKVVRRIDKSLDFPIVRPRVKEGRDI